MPKLFTQFFVKIDGQDISKELMDDILEIVVDTSIYLPGMFTMLIQDPALKWVDASLLEVGKTVEISAEATEQAGGGARGTLIAGEITALEPDFSAEGATTLLVRGYDKSHRLHRGKKTRTFTQQTDSGIATTIAEEAGLSVEADATSITHEYVLQNNQTNMEFLLARARRIGYKVLVSNGKLYFKPATATLGTGPSLKLGQNLRSFRPRLAAAHQVDKIKVMGWDPDTKQAIVGEASPSGTQGGISEPGGTTARSRFGGSATVVIVDRPVATADEANALAAALSDEINNEFVTAEGVCFGDPRLTAGKQVSVEQVGSRFSGSYVVTAATHVFSQRGYETSFTISGREPNTVHHLLEYGSGEGQRRGLIRGVVPAVVTNLNDPRNLGRVKVKFPWLADEIESTWARLATPAAGSQRGFYFLPEVNDEVLVAFEHGDPARPFVLGSLWNNTDKPPKENSQVVANGKVNERVIKSRSGHVIILDDTENAEKIVIRDKTSNNEIVISSSDNKLSIKIEDSINIEAKGTISVKSTAGDMSIECKNFSVKALQNCSLEATQSMSIEAKQACTLKAMASCTVEGTASVTVKNAAAQVALNGPIVNINNGALEVM